MERGRRASASGGTPGQEREAQASCSLLRHQRNIHHHHLRFRHRALHRTGLRRLRSRRRNLRLDLGRCLGRQRRGFGSCKCKSRRSLQRRPRVGPPRSPNRSLLCRCSSRGHRAWRLRIRHGSCSVHAPRIGIQHRRRTHKTQYPHGTPRRRPDIVRDGRARRRNHCDSRSSGEVRTGSSPAFRKPQMSPSASRTLRGQRCIDRKDRERLRSRCAPCMSGGLRRRTRRPRTSPAELSFPRRNQCCSCTPLGNKSLPRRSQRAFRMPVQEVRRSSHRRPRPGCSLRAHSRRFQATGQLPATRDTHCHTRDSFGGACDQSAQGDGLGQSYRAFGAPRLRRIVRTEWKTLSNVEEKRAFSFPRG